MNTEKKKKDPLFGAAILKVSLEMKGMLGEGENSGYNEILEGVMEDLGVSEDEVERYISEHREKLETICREKGIKKEDVH